MKPASLLVTLVRHGETYMNSQKLLQGHSDTPLSEIGMEQARKLGRSLSSTTFTSAYSSDLQRAYNTAKLILGEITVSTPEIVQDRRLRERCYGDAEGRPAQEYAKRAAEAKVNVQNFVPNGGESIAELSQRVGDFFIALCKLSEISTSDEHVLVVSHGGWLNGLMRHLNEGTDNYELNNFSPSQAIRIHQNTGITVISITPLSSDSEQSKYKVDFRKINDVSHLAEETI